MKIPRALLALVVLIILFACAKTLTKDAPARLYIIDSANWSTVTVAFGCNGVVTKRVHNIEIGPPTRGRLRTAAWCESPSFLVTLVGSSETFSSPPIMGWTPGSTLAVNVTNALHLTSWLVW